MTRGRVDAILWTLFAAASAAVFTISYVDVNLDYPGLLVAAGFMNTALAVALVWRSGISLALPIVIAIYVLASKEFLYLIFLTVVFFRGS